MLIQMGLAKKYRHTNKLMTGKNLMAKEKHAEVTSAVERSNYI